jgi:hypothetical protein
MLVALATPHMYPAGIALTAYPLSALLDDEQSLVEQSAAVVVHSPTSSEYVFPG